MEPNVCLCGECGWPLTSAQVDDLYDAMWREARHVLGSLFDCPICGAPLPAHPDTVHPILGSIHAECVDSALSLVRL